MNKKLNKVVFGIIFIAVLSIFITKHSLVKADDSTEIEVNSASTFLAALDTIHSDSNKSYLINVTADFQIDSTSGVTKRSTIDNGNNVTIKGNGHTIRFTLTQNDKILVANGATLNLGLPDGSDTLCIKGSSGATQESLISISTAIVHMYDGVTLSDNDGGVMALSGAAVHVGDNSAFYMHGGSIKNNSASGPGGGISVDGSDSKLYITGGEISNNQTEQTGGGIYVCNGNYASIENVIISGNKAGWYGGGIVNQDAHVVINNATIDTNKALSNEYGYGGGITSLTETSEGVASTTISGSTITNNTAIIGGGLCNTGNSSCTLSGNTIKNNIATAYYGGGIYSDSPIISKNDEITENTSAAYAGGVCINGGTADLSTSKVYNNKATAAGNDYYIGSSTTAINIMEPGFMEKQATIGDDTVTVNLWHVDSPSSRYSSTNRTSAVYTSKITAGRSYLLVAADGGCKVSYDNDGKSETDDEIRFLVLDGKVKLNLNGGEGPSTEIDLNNDTTIENPTRGEYVFTGWTEDTESTEDGYELILKANWYKDNKYTVTFNSNGGEGEMSPQTFVYGKETELSKNTFSKSSYTFTSWNTKSDGSGNSYTDMQSVKNLTDVDGGNVILYAQWKVTDETTDTENNVGEEENNNNNNDNKTEQEETETKSNIDNNVKIKTGDNIMKWVITLGVAFAVFGYIMIARKKYRETKGRRFK